MLEDNKDGKFKDHVAQLVSSVVVYTPVPADELMEEMVTWDLRLTDLVHSVRQKPGHVILMAPPEKDGELRGLVGWLKGMGAQAKEYKIGQAPNGGLAGVSAQGLQTQVNSTGICHAYLQGKKCRFGANCKFRCNPQP